MDISTTALLNAAVQTRQANAAQEVQVSVLKKAMDVQKTTAMALLQAIPASLPLAPSGAVGTNINQLV